MSFLVRRDSQEVDNVCTVVQRDEYCCWKSVSIQNVVDVVVVIAGGGKRGRIVLP